MSHMTFVKVQISFLLWCSIGKLIFRAAGEFLHRNNASGHRTQLEMRLIVAPVSHGHLMRNAYNLRSMALFIPFCIMLDWV